MLLGNKSRGIKYARHVARMEETRNAYKILMGKHEGTRQIGRHGVRIILE
jgi:hypothetical protein